MGRQSSGSSAAGNCSIQAIGVNHSDGLDVQMAKHPLVSTLVHAQHSSLTICTHVMGMTLNYIHTECWP